MNSSRPSTPLASLAPGDRAPFELLVAYEDVPTRHRALHLSHHLSRQFTNDYDFRCSWWKFDHLANSILREQATHAAADANMIVLALNARPQLEPLQSEWIQSWLPLRQHHRSRKVNGALVALVALMANAEPAMTEGAKQTTEHLRQMAAAARLDFFAHAFELPALGAGENPDSQLLVPGQKLDLEPDPADSRRIDPTSIHFKMPIPRWGINE